MSEPKDHEPKQEHGTSPPEQNPGDKGGNGGYGKAVSAEISSDIATRPQGQTPPDILEEPEKPDDMGDDRKDGPEFLESKDGKDVSEPDQAPTPSTNPDTQDVQSVFVTPDSTDNIDDITQPESSNNPETSCRTTVLTPQQVAALPYFVGCKTIIGACRAAKISRDTYYQWIKEPQFKAELERMREQVIQDGISKLKGAFNEAVEGLIKLMKSKGEKGDYIRLRAIQTILDNYLRHRQVNEVDRQIAELKGEKLPGDDLESF